MWNLPQPNKRHRDWVSSLMPLGPMLNARQLTNLALVNRYNRSCVAPNDHAQGCRCLEDLLEEHGRYLPAVMSWEDMTFLTGRVGCTSSCDYSTGVHQLLKQCFANPRGKPRCKPEDIVMSFLESNDVEGHEVLTRPAMVLNQALGDTVFRVRQSFRLSTLHVLFRRKGVCADVINHIAGYGGVQDHHINQEVFVDPQKLIPLRGASPVYRFRSPLPLCRTSSIDAELYELVRDSLGLFGASLFKKAHHEPAGRDFRCGSQFMLPPVWKDVHKNNAEYMAKVFGTSPNFPLLHDRAHSGTAMAFAWPPSNEDIMSIDPPPNAMEHQKEAFDWCRRLEHKLLLGERCSASVDFSEFIPGHLWVDHLHKKFHRQKPTYEFSFKGGVIADDVGLGKTFIGVSLLRGDLPNDDPTLVIVPRAGGTIADQWKASSSHLKGCYVVRDMRTLTTALTALSGKQCRMLIVDVYFITKNANFKKHPTKLQGFPFKRVLLDEAHSYDGADLIKKLRATSKFVWMITATPLAPFSGRSGLEHAFHTLNVSCNQKQLDAETTKELMQTRFATMARRLFTDVLCVKRTREDTGLLLPCRNMWISCRVNREDMVLLKACFLMDSMNISYSMELRQVCDGMVEMTPGHLNMLLRDVTRILALLGKDTYQMQRWHSNISLAGTADGDCECMLRADMSTREWKQCVDAVVQRVFKMCTLEAILNMLGRRQDNRAAVWACPEHFATCRVKEYRKRMIQEIHAKAKNRFEVLWNARPRVYHYQAGGELVSWRNGLYKLKPLVSLLEMIQAKTMDTSDTRVALFLDQDYLVQVSNVLAAQGFDDVKVANRIKSNDDINDFVTKKRKREAAGAPKLLIVSYQSDKVAGMDLKGCTHLVLMAPPRGDKLQAKALYKQAVGRVERTGRKDLPVIVRFCTQNTTEPEAWKHVLPSKKVV